MRNVYLITAFAVVLLVSLFGFRGSLFTSSPIDVFPEWAFPGMKRQPKPKPQGESKFFADGRADRPLPAGVVSSDPLRNDDALYAGKHADGSWVRGFPVAVNHQLMARGQDRFTIYCAPCHGAVGDGNGITKQYGMGATPTYHDDRLRQMAEGELFNTITHGSPNKNMLPYADKLLPEDRWAVILYVRALQRAQLGTAADVTDANARETLGLK
ncbi:MAG: Cytochrome c [Verrucomicrobia bacterium]|jgi:mono/diheme cytochrome c family protein|nr:MAG: Cytochrome c [Verrucomicrobiota bacterium]